MWPKIQVYSTQPGIQLGERVCSSLTDYIDARQKKLSGKFRSDDIGIEETEELKWISLLKENNYYMSLKYDGKDNVSDRFKLGKVKYSRFSDGEFKHELLDSVRGKNIFLINAPYESYDITPEDIENVKRLSKEDDDMGLEKLLAEMINKKRKISDNIIEELALIDCFKSNSAKKVFLFSPYRATSRQDHKNSREGITAALFADLEKTAGLDYAWFTELHSRQIAGFYRPVPVDNFNPYKLLIDKFVEEAGINLGDISTSSPDVGGTGRARYVAKELHSSLTLTYKGRDYSKVNKVQSIIVIGDPKVKTVIPDDMVDTAGTIKQGVLELIKKGAKEAYILVPHALLSGPGVERLDELYEKGLFKGLYTTDSICRGRDFMEKNPWYHEVSLAPTSAEAIYKISKEQSVSGVYR